MKRPKESECASPQDYAIRLEAYMKSRGELTWGEVANAMNEDGVESAAKMVNRRIFEGEE